MTLKKDVQLLTVTPWTNKLKRRIKDLNVKEIRALINAGFIPTEKNKKKADCIAYTTETAGIKLVNAARIKMKKSLSKPVSKKAKEISTNSPLPDNMLIEKQMVWVGKSFCPAVNMGVPTFNGYVKEGLFKKANIRIEKVGNGTERAKYKIEWPGLEKALKIKKICYSHKSLEDKQDLMKDLLEPDDDGLEEEPDLTEELKESEETAEEALSSDSDELLSKPVHSSKEKIKEAFLELMVALVEPIALRLKKKGILK